ncbi:hypothetical protein NE237_013180 [Protea cynaroides]|uniref:Uncharacterized protein n=1 Tax=Protea cynaroides TaxID=273540 RepID=A0A9Q0H2H0_9MAGN|nr:hypothetical protein NE237_013180 [Protea cynaroides]
MLKPILEHKVPPSHMAEPTAAVPNEGGAQCSFAVLLDFSDPMDLPEPANQAGTHESIPEADTHESVPEAALVNPSADHGSPVQPRSNLGRWEDVEDEGKDVMDNVVTDSAKHLDHIVMPVVTIADGGKENRVDPITTTEKRNNEINTITDPRRSLVTTSPGRVEIAFDDVSIVDKCLIEQDGESILAGKRPPGRLAGKGKK